MEKIKKKKKEKKVKINYIVMISIKSFLEYKVGWLASSLVKFQ